MNRQSHYQPPRLPLVGATLEHLRHRERIDWHDHAEQQLVYPSHGLLIVSTARGSWVVPPQRAAWLPAAVAHAVPLPDFRATFGTTPGRYRKDLVRSAPA